MTSELMSESVCDMQVAIATSKKALAAAVTTAKEPMDTAAPGQQAEAVPTTATPPQPSFVYTAAPPAAPVPYVWGSWQPCGPGYEQGNSAGAGTAPPLRFPPCAWYYPVVADPRGGSPPTSTYPPPFQDQPRPAEQTGSPGGETAEEDTDEDPCSLTLAIDVDKRSTSSSAPSAAGPGQQHALPSDRDKAATAAEARKRRKELTKLKQMHGGGGGRPGGGEHW
ncbi:hypothetical protein ABZP36_009150 [Zizania latifolia]